MGSLQAGSRLGLSHASSASTKNSFRYWQWLQIYEAAPVLDNTALCAVDGLVPLPAPGPLVLGEWVGGWSRAGGEVGGGGQVGMSARGAEDWVWGGQGRGGWV